LLAVAGTLIALASAAGTLLVLGGRIDGLESRSAATERDLSKAFGLISGVKRTADNAYSLANKAIQDVIFVSRALSALSEALRQEIRTIAITLREEITFLTDRTLAALRRLENFINERINFVLESTRIALGRVYETIASVNGAINSANNAISNLQGKVNILERAAQQLYGLVFMALQEIGRAATLLDLEAVRSLASGAWALARDANTVATNALTQAQRAIATAASLIARVNTLDGLIPGINARVDGIAGQMAGTIAIANGATIAAQRAIATAQQALQQKAIPGLQGIPGVAGRDGINGRDGVDGRDGELDVVTTTAFIGQIRELLDTRLNESGNRTTTELLTGLAAPLNAIPAATVSAFVASPAFRTGVAQAAATGVCQTMQPGGCGHRALNNSSNNLFNKLRPLLNDAANAAQLALLREINLKLGAQIVGGISGKLVNGFKWLQLDRVMNLLTFAATMHNAAMLSQNVIQTLTQAIQNVVELIGVKDDEQQIIDVSSLLSTSITNLIKGAMGAENFEAFIKEWNKYNRIYQASANLFSSLMNMGDSIVNGLQVIGGQTGKIGNALRAWGVVSETAYKWFNPEPNFSNPLLTKLNSLEESASMVENVTQQPLNVKSAKKETEDALKELNDSLAQKPDAPKGKEFPEPEELKKDFEEGVDASPGKDIEVKDLDPDD
jgi:hypothetical protein